MPYKKSEKRNYESNDTFGNSISTPLSKSISKSILVPIIVDNIQNGCGSFTKIQDIYTNIREACGLRPIKPAFDYIQPRTQVSEKPMLYGSVMYQIDGAVIKFKIFKFFDPIEEKMNESRKTDFSKKYISATRMEIIVSAKPKFESKKLELEETIKKTIAKYDSKIL
jgi:hypothetical protein